MDKNELRASVLSALKGYGRRRKESEEIVKIVVSHQKWTEATTILAFSPLSTEPDISPLLSDKRILLPYITEDGSMEFGKGEMRKNRLGFMEPVASSPAFYDFALMLVPLVAVDKSGMRLGRGKGYYDRYIRDNRSRLYTIGVALSPSLVHEVPYTEEDMRVDEVVLAEL